MQKPTTSQRILELVVEPDWQGNIVEFLCGQSGISKRQLKDALQKGAVWLRKPRGKLQRIRRATTPVKKGDFVALYFDHDLLQREPPQGRQLWRCPEYSVWYKPAGLLSQGNRFGDHASLLRQAELLDPLRKPVYLVHRLDREAEGLMLLAHTQTAARRLSQLFQRQQVEKKYEVTVCGKLSEPGGEITHPLDGKPAHTIYEVQAYDDATDTSRVKVNIKTGRKHQIRRHFLSIGHPVMGDPAYGRKNKNSTGMQLKACLLGFTCPFRDTPLEFELAALFAEANN
jgi:tRNA pseudouridine32 synthase/23S rRNA pseudouridine746 synthase